MSAAALRMCARASICRSMRRCGLREPAVVLQPSPLPVPFYALHLLVTHIAWQEGGGFFVYTSSTLTVVESTISGCSTTVARGPGGGVNVDSGAAFFRRSHLIGNHAAGVRRLRQGSHSLRPRRIPHAHSSRSSAVCCPPRIDAHRATGRWWRLCRLSNDAAHGKHRL